MTITHAALTAPPHPATTGRVERAIAKVARDTGIGFDYLMQKANVESSMNPSAKARRSSATGLFQFIEKTWLEMVRDHGSKYGLGQYAACIDDGCNVNDPRLKQKILNLRQDPELSAYMAAEYAATNAKVLEDRVGHLTTIGDTELYLAHFLGAGGASRFLTALSQDPAQPAASLFRAEAGRNPGVFYKNGKPQTLAQIYDRFAARFDNASTAPQAQERSTPIPREKPAPSTLADNMSLELDRLVYTSGPDTPVSLSITMINRLLAAPVTRLVAEAPAQTQARLLFLAQSMAHTDNDRYNA